MAPSIICVDDVKINCYCFIIGFAARILIRVISFIASLISDCGRVISFIASLISDHGVLSHLSLV